MLTTGDGYLARPDTVRWVPERQYCMWWAGLAATTKGLLCVRQNDPCASGFNRKSTLIRTRHAGMRMCCWDRLVITHGYHVYLLSNLITWGYCTSSQRCSTMTYHSAVFTRKFIPVDATSSCSRRVFLSEKVPSRWGWGWFEDFTLKALHLQSCLQTMLT